MFKRTLLNTWYDNKNPLYDLSTCGIILKNSEQEILKQWVDEIPLMECCGNYSNILSDELLVHLLAQKYHCNAENILITNGASEALFIVLHTYSGEKVNILYQRPYYHNLDDIILSTANKPIHIDLREEDDFEFHMEELQSMLDLDPKLLILNFPNNPTGVDIDEAEYDKILKIAQNRKMMVLFDEVCADINYNNKVGYIESNIHNYFDCCICINSMSKSYGLPGLRIGWIVADKSFIKACKAVKEQISVTSSPFLQMLAGKVMEQHKSIIRRNINIVKKNIDYLNNVVNKDNSGFFKLVLPKGGACCFAKVIPKIDVYRFCDELYKRNHILITPGSAFGYRNYIRIGVGITHDDFKVAISELFAYKDKY